MKKNTTKTTNLFLKFTAILLALTILAGAVFFVLEFCSPSDSFLKPSGWFQPAAPNDPAEPDEPAKNPDEEKRQDGNLIVDGTVKAEGATMLSTVIPKEDYEANGISPQAESAVTLTITDIEPDYAADKSFTWQLDFLGNIDSEHQLAGSWYALNDRNVTDYMSITVSEDTLTAVVQCNQAFGAVISATAVANSNPDVKLQCRFDYVARVNSAQLKCAQQSALPGSSIKIGSNWMHTLTSDIQFTDYTILPEFSYNTDAYSLEFSDELKSGTAFSDVAQAVTINANESNSYVIPNNASYEWFCGFFSDGSPTHVKEVVSRVNAMNAERNYRHLVCKLNYIVSYNGETLYTGTADSYFSLEFESVPVSDANLNESHIIFT